MIARRGKRLALEAAVDRLYLEARELQYQLQFTASDDTNGEVVGPPALQRTRGAVSFVEQVHLHELCGRVVVGDGEAVEPAVGQFAGEIMTQPRSARWLSQLLRRECGNLDAEQAIWNQVFARISQECQRVIHAFQTQERVEGADGQPVAPPWIRAAHVSYEPLDAPAFLLTTLDHLRRELDGGNLMACCGER